MSDRLDSTLASAIAAGILPADAVRLAEDTRPWPVVLLTALGAWLAAIPLLSVVMILWGDWLSGDLGPYLIGALLLAGATVVLRARGLSLFVEQLAVPALLVGLGSLGYGLGEDLPKELAMALLAALSLALAASLPRPWLRVLLGAAAAGLLVLSLSFLLANGRDLFAWHSVQRTAIWASLHLALGAWLAGIWAQGALGQRATASAAAALDAIGAGWLLATLAGLALMSGMTMLVGAGMDPAFRDLGQALSSELSRHRDPLWVHGGSVVLVLAATIWGARVWSGLRRPWVLGAGVAVAGLAWFLPSLGGVWLALVVAATTWRLGLAGAAAFAAAWIVGSFYYQLSWPLAPKALVLAVVGVLLGALVWLGAGLRPVWQARTAGQWPGLAPWLIGLTAIGTLAVANVGIWQKETLIAQGRPVFLELAPVDPRSLMQGDFMRLRFRLPAEADGQPRFLARGRPQVVARRDAMGVATLLRLRKPDEALAEGEFPIELTPKDGHWTVATDAWFFREGDSERWQAAHYGEFRVTPDGQALLVGLAGADLKPIGVGD
jgi:uncharacterized membrane-anchored protein